MSQEFQVYDLDQVSCNFAGLPIESGYGDGGAIKIEQLTPDFTTKEGADGSVVRSRTGKKLTKVTITLLQTAKGNATLSTLNNIDRAGSNGAGVAPFFVRDRGGTFLFAATESWIEGPPANAEFGAEATNREWIIMCARPERFDGGN